MSKKTEHTLSICAIIIAILSLFVAVHENYQQRKHYRLSIKPALKIIFSTQNNWEGYKLLSSGLGPAKIKWMKLFVDDHLMQNWNDVMERLNLSIPENYSINAVYPNDVFKPGETVNLFFIIFGKFPEVMF